jgi:ABC-type Mn2+/Zn2+ transport system permease subunit
LIVPAVCGVMLARSWMRRLLVGWGAAAIASLIGLLASYRLDLPTGAAIVVATGLLLAAASVVARMQRGAVG